MTMGRFENLDVLTYWDLKPVWIQYVYHVERLLEITLKKNEQKNEQQHRKKFLNLCFKKRRYYNNADNHLSGWSIYFMYSC